MTLQPRLAAMTALVILGMVLGGCASWSSSDSGQQSADAYTELGMGYLSKGQADKARAALGKALAKQSNDAAALHGMALLEQREGNTQASAAYYQRALSALANAKSAADNAAISTPQVQNNYASLLFEQGDTKGACAQLAQAAKDTHYPGRAGVLVNLSQCRLMAGDKDNARQVLEEAQRLAPHQPTVIIAVAYQKLEDGDIAGSRAYLTRYEQMAGSGSREAQVLDAALTRKEHQAASGGTSIQSSTATTKRTSE
ncbi:hypothetical protein R84981_001878 [Carnimonas sp. R-84981]|uniref:tetratricopeptide repeat protein n=1 Tax=Carnimonas bestiolae TaxID=3402172 RepID=UPI003EDC2DFB